ncbi:MAG: methyl-accepting chemotaxis protein [Paracoccaceae bacterium]
MDSAKKQFFLPKIKLDLKISNLILTWVLAPILLLALVTAVALQMASSRTQSGLDMASQSFKSANRIAQVSNAMSVDIINVFQLQAALLKTRRSNLSAKSFEPVKEVELRASLRRTIRAYQGKVIQFQAIAKQGGVEDPTLALHILTTSRAALNIDRLMSLYTVSNSRTLRLAKAGDFDAAQANFKYEEQPLLGKISEQIRHVSSSFSLSSQELLTLIAETEEKNAKQIIEQDKGAFFLTCAAVLGLAFLVGVGAFFSVRKKIIRPVKAIPNLIDNIDQEDADSTQQVDSSIVNRRDELGDVIRSVMAFGTRIQERRQAEEEQRKMDEDRQRQEQRKVRLESEAREKEAADRDAATKAAAEAAEQKQQQQQQKTVQEQLQQQQSVVKELSLGLQALANSDLSRLITAELPEGYDELRQLFNSAISDLSSILDNIRSTTEQIRSEFAQVTNASNNLSKSAQEQAAALEESSAALEELSVSIESVAGSANNIEKNVEGTTHKAKQGYENAQKTVEAMQDIRESSQDISKITSLISDIAFQTNLLALNAGVEAARAGEEGRGFAVVASEVRALAQRASTAAEDISALILKSVENVQTGDELVGAVATDFEAISTSILQISTDTKNMALAASEQAHGVGEINKTVVEIERITQGNAAMSEELAAAAENVSADCDVLLNDIQKFSVLSLENTEAVVHVKVA